MSSILIAAPWCPHVIYSIITQRYNCARKYWNIYFPWISFLLCELLKWAALWKTANQSRAQHWAAEWNSQSEQSSTLLFMTLPNKPITDHFVLGTNPRVVNGHVKPYAGYTSQDNWADFGPISSRDFPCSNSGLWLKICCCVVCCLCQIAAHHTL